MISGDLAGVILLWDIATRRERAALPREAQGVRTLAVSPGGTLLVVGLDDGTVVVWDLTTNQERLRKAFHGDRVRAVTFSRDGLLATTGDDGRVRLWDVPAGQLVRELPRQDGGVP